LENCGSLFYKHVLSTAKHAVDLKCDKTWSLITDSNARMHISHTLASC